MIFSLRKRTFDILLVLMIIVVIFIPMIITSLLILLNSGRPIFHFSKRVGKKNKFFYMPKFRTMIIDTPDVESNKIKNPEKYITSLGKFLRRHSIDEIPQLWSILIGQMSFVGPRPALYSQEDLINRRKEEDLDLLTPGLTGWAQINGRDELSMKEKVELECFYRDNQSFLLDMKILCLTVITVIIGKGVIH